MNVKKKVTVTILCLVAACGAIWGGGWMVYEYAGFWNSATPLTWSNLLFMVMSVAVFTGCLTFYLFERRVKEVSPQKISSVVKEETKKPEMNEEELRIAKINLDAEEKLKRWREDCGISEEEVTMSSEGRDRKKELEEAKLDVEIELQKRYAKDIKEGKIIIEPPPSTLPVGKTEMRVTLRRANEPAKKVEGNDEPDLPPQIDDDDGGMPQ